MSFTGLMTERQQRQNHKATLASVGAFIFAVAIVAAFLVEGKTYPADPYSATQAGTVITYSLAIKGAMLGIAGGALLYGVYLKFASFGRHHRFIALLFALLATGHGIFWALFTRNHAPFLMKYPLPVSISISSFVAAVLLVIASSDLLETWSSNTIRFFSDYMSRL